MKIIKKLILIWLISIATFIILIIMMFFFLTGNFSASSEDDTDNSNVNTGIAATDGMTYPLSKFYISANYGMYAPYGYYQMHDGIDLAVSSGTPLYAMANGVVYDVGSGGARGNYIYILYNVKGKYISSTYFHMRDPSLLKVGDKVDNNTKVGLVGSTGNSTGAHLHLELAVIPKKNVDNISVNIHNIYRSNPRNTINFPSLHSSYNDSTRKLINE